MEPTNQILSHYDTQSVMVETPHIGGLETKYLKELGYAREGTHEELLPSN